MDDSIYCMISSYFTMACSARAIVDIFTMSVSIKYLFSDWTSSYEITARECTDYIIEAEISNNKITIDDYAE